MQIKIPVPGGDATSLHIGNTFCVLGALLLGGWYEMCIRDRAETAQKNSNEKVYRESAIRKQIEFLQQQLDEMHPENISDVRRFQKKIQESGMNEEARKEAEKVLNRMKQEGKDSHEYGMLYEDVYKRQGCLR